ncbi:uncharacterized protein LOC130509539 [Raphanus sativus]|nr:uncharacterized protein LOC130509539 [Raphanus sativus]
MVKKPFSLEAQTLVLNKAEKNKHSKVVSCCKNDDGDEEAVVLEWASKHWSLLIILLTVVKMVREEEDEEAAAELEWPSKSWFLLNLVLIAAQMIREEEEFEAEFEALLREEEAQGGSEEEELAEAMESFDRFKDVMKTKIPKKKEDRKGFSLYDDGKYMRGLGYHAAKVIPNYTPERGFGSDDKVVYVSFSGFVSTGRAYLIEFLDHALVLRWVKEKGGVRKELARTHYVDLVAEVDNETVTILGGGETSSDSE